MSEERCEGCGSTCVCCCECGWDEDDLLDCKPQECPPFQTMTLDITKFWFGEKYGWLTYDEIQDLGLHEQGQW